MPTDSGGPAPYTDAPLISSAPVIGVKSAGWIMGCESGALGARRSAEERAGRGGVHRAPI
jgi:hypothetical protein